MPDYRRHRIPGRTYFFPVNLLERKGRLLVYEIEGLRAAAFVARHPVPLSTRALHSLNA